MYDVIVVGGGPAGLSAALALGRTRRSTLVVDSGEPRNAPAAHMHNFISRDGTPPAEMRAIAREEIGRYDSVELRDDEAIDAQPLPGVGFEVSLAGSDAVQGRRLVLATGVIDEHPPIEGLSEHWGRGVYHCPYCHGYEVSDMPVAVLGTSPAAVNLAVHLTRLSDDVALLTNGADELEEATAMVLGNAGVRIIHAPVTRLEGHDGQLEQVVFTNGDALARQAVFSAVSTMRQRSTLPLRLGCAMLPDDAVEIDELGRTSVNGVFAAGDMARRSTGGRMAAVITAAASGTVAGAAADKDLLAEEFGLPPMAIPAPARTA